MHNKSWLIYLMWQFNDLLIFIRPFFVKKKNEQNGIIWKIGIMEDTKDHMKVSTFNLL